ncbi:MAG TPA: NifU family protein [Candidatus Xenobia bacterium]|jgi:Fe-S cluster biogenesis protein NfuA/nitrite reductase/ring-hydroxylating ferredoxin subunit
MTTNETATRVQQALDRLHSLPDPRARQWGQEAVRALLELYGAGLERMLDCVHKASPALLDELAKDPLVSSLMVVHNLHPWSVLDRIEQALEGVRPYLRSHAGDVRLLEYAEGVVRLSLEGTCHGCPSSSVTMKLAVEKAIMEAVPEALRIQVEGQAEQPEVMHGDWLPVAETVPPGEVTSTVLSGQSVVLCRVGGQVFAWADRCPGGDHGLRGSTMRQAVLVCGACGRKFDVRKAGRCLDADLQLSPLPLRQETEHVLVAVPA